MPKLCIYVSSDLGGDSAPHTLFVFALITQRCNIEISRNHVSFWTVSFDTKITVGMGNRIPIKVRAKSKSRFRRIEPLRENLALNTTAQ